MNNFKDIDSRPLLKTCGDRFRGNDRIFPVTARSHQGKGKGRGEYRQERKEMEVSLPGQIKGFSWEPSFSFVLIFLQIFPAE